MAVGVVRMLHSKFKEMENNTSIRKGLDIHGVRTNLHTLVAIEDILSRGYNGTLIDLKSDQKKEYYIKWYKIILRLLDSVG